MEVHEKDVISDVQTNNRLSLIILLILIGIVAGLFLFLYFNNPNMSTEGYNIKDFIENKLLELGEKDGQKVINEIIGFENSAFITYKDQLVECNSQAIKFIDKQGKTLWEYPTKINNPILKKSGSSLIIADIGGKELYAVNGSYIDWEKEFSENIINVDVNSNGYVTVIKEAKGLKATLTLFDNSGNEIFTKGFSGIYILSAKVSPDNRTIAVNCVNTSGVSVISSIEFLDIFGETKAGAVSDVNQVYSAIYFIDRNHVLASGDTGAACYKTDGSLIWGNNFGGRKVYSANILEGGYTAVAASGDNTLGSLLKKRPEVIILNSKGEVFAKHNIEKEILNINAYSDIIAVNSGRMVSFVNRKGKLLSTYSSKSDIKSVYFFSRLEAALVTKQGVSIIKTY